MRAVDATHYVRSVRLLRDQIDSFDPFPFHLPAVRNLSELTFHPAGTFLVGENGSGKSTLWEGIAIAYGYNPEGGSRNFNFATRNSHSVLHRHLRLVRGVQRPKDGYFLRAESFFNVATEVDRLDEVGGAGPPLIDAYGGRSLHEQSHGESFMALVMERFRGQGLYLLDEPEAALSPSRQLALLLRLHELVARRSQFLIATHSPLLLAYPNARIYSLEQDGIRAVAYEDTEHFVIARRFLQDHRRMLADLLDP
ncbi:MAG: AAA family ATPase [Longimicrobiales bacterium]